MQGHLERAALQFRMKHEKMWNTNQHRWMIICYMIKVAEYIYIDIDIHKPSPIKGTLGQASLATGRLGEIFISRCLSVKLQLNKNNNRHQEQIEQQLPSMPRCKC